MNKFKFCVLVSISLILSYVSSIKLKSHNLNVIFVAPVKYHVNKTSENISIPRNHSQAVIL